MNVEKLINKALQLDFLDAEEGSFLYKNASIGLLMYLGNAIRKKLHPENNVTWIIDRNVNITNVCISGCRFCNFYRPKGSEEAYITSFDEYREKIDTLFKLGGRQLLLQGGMHPDLGLEFYTSLFCRLKNTYPELKLHALGPPEIHHIAGLENLSYEEVLDALINAGLDSLPGAGAEILSDRVRKKISKGKCLTEAWLNVMRTAHKKHLITSATMMFGHIETPEERLEHLINIRNVQHEKPENSPGFISFIPWPFQDNGTILARKGVKNQSTAEDYIRLIAISRIMLPNIKNIQASWLTVGKETGQICLHSGANDMGSIMIEENVVSSAGASYSFDEKGITEAIRQAGFHPVKRNQKFEAV